MSDADWANLASFLVFVNRLTWSIAIAIDVVLVLVLFKTAGSHRRRLITFGGLTATCGVLSVVLPLVIPSLRSSFTFPYFNFALDVFDRAAESAIVISGIPFIVLLISNVEHHSRPLPLRQKNSGGLDVPAQHIEVLIARSQRMNWLNRVIFVIDARMGVGAEQLDLISKYRLGKTIVFDSARRERQNELARTHLESARERNTRTICLWREEVRGFFRRIWLLIRALISFLLGFLFIRITLAKLIRGTHVESKSLDTILAAKNAIERGAGDLKAYLEVAETFDGREDLFEPS